MTRTLLYQSGHKWRLGVAFGAAVVIHLAAISFASIRRTETAIPAGISYDPPVIQLEPEPPTSDPPVELSDPLPTPAPAEDSFPEDRSTPAPARSPTKKVRPIVRQQNSTNRNPLPVLSAKVFALSAPRPEYPYEARRQKLAGDGIVVMTVDPITGSVTSVFMSKTTGSPFLDNAALAGFKRWRFRPGTVSSVACPVTFTLTGASY